MAALKLESWYTKLTRLLRASCLVIRTGLRSVLAFSYGSTLNHYTTQPLDRIRLLQHDVAGVAIFLAEFREIKEQVLNFVNQGNPEHKSALVFAAGIGVFSWSDVATSFWLCTVFWRTSLFLSIFALISSGQQRLMKQLPQSKTEAFGTIENRIRALLLLALRGSFPKRTSNIEMASSASPASVEMVHSPVLYRVWQTKIMLMNFGWLAFLLVLLFYLLSPSLADAGIELWPAGTKRKATMIPTAVGLVTFLNFEFSSRVVHSVISKLKTSHQPTAPRSPPQS